MNKDKSEILSLPEELILQFLKGLHIKDLLNVRSTHPFFTKLIDNHPVLWAHTSFWDAWPSPQNLRHFNKASDIGNVEALVKLGIAYLYNEGLPADFQGKNVTYYGEQAAEFFCKVERLLSTTIPFTWLFIRPPWALTGACCKETAFSNMKKYVTENAVPNVVICIAKTLQLLDDHTHHVEAVEYLQQATSYGSAHAAYLLWHEVYAKKVNDPASELSAIRELRRVVTLSDPEAVIELCRYYAKKKYGGLSEAQAAAFVRDFIKSSKSSCLEDIYKNSELTHSMRYILVDWLVEVAGMKNFGTSTLHVAISVVDRFLRFHPMSRAQFQLLGVAAMVLCARFLGKDIITIREAAWLTDNTYKYEDVVRMMGEIMATLRGNIRVWCSYDYVQLIGLLAENDKKTQLLAEYICELALLQSEIGCLPHAEVAACAVLLARLTLRKEFPWPHQMLQFTGYCVPTLANSTMLILEKCFLQDAMRDHRSVVLEAVKERYADGVFESASSIQILSAEELQCLLGMHFNTSNVSENCSDLINTKDLIMSPSRNKGGHAKRPCVMSEEREKAATPTFKSMENSFEVLENSFEALLNDSVLSGYDGDLEDEREYQSEEESTSETSFIEHESSSSQSLLPRVESSLNQSGTLWRLSDSSFSAFVPSTSSKPCDNSSRMGSQYTSSSSSSGSPSSSPPTIRINLPSLGYRNTSPLNTSNACFLNQTGFKPLSQSVQSTSQMRTPSASFHSQSSPSSTIRIYTDQSASNVSDRDSKSSQNTLRCNTRPDVTPGQCEEEQSQCLSVSKRGAFCNISNVSHPQGRPTTSVKPRKRKTSGQLGNECKTHVISQ